MEKVAKVCMTKSGKFWYFMPLLATFCHSNFVHFKKSVAKSCLPPTLLSFVYRVRDHKMFNNHGYNYRESYEEANCQASCKYNICYV